MKEVFSPQEFLAQGLASLAAPMPYELWFPAPVLPPEVEHAPPKKITRTRTFQRPRLRPSDEGHASLPGVAIFSRTGGLDLGSEVHDLLAEIVWEHNRSPVVARSEGEKLVVAFLRSAAGHEVFKQPSPDSIVWRERAVACRLEQRLVSAQMDRVVITPPSGGLGDIVVYDFKTDQGSPASIAARYEAQMKTYVKILEAYSGGQHRLRAFIATIRIPEIIPVAGL